MDHLQFFQAFHFKKNIKECYLCKTMVKRRVCTLGVLREHELSESNLCQSSSPYTRRSWDDPALAARALTHRAISLTHKLKKK